MFYTNAAIEEGLKDVPHANQLNLAYEEFCENPIFAWENLLHKLNGLGCELKSDKMKVRRFDSSNKIIINKKDTVNLQMACENFFEMEK